MPNKLILIAPENMHPWGAPQVLPPGALDCILSGHPANAELYTFRFKLPADYLVPPFQLTVPCCMTILTGSLHIGENDKIEKDKCRHMPAESFINIPANLILYFWTTEKTTLQFHGMGPIGFKSA